MQAHQSNGPRVRIVKFFNFQDKIQVMCAARAKGKDLCDGQEIMFIPDLSTELHRRRKGFDRVKQQLMTMNIRYGIIYPAKLQVTSDGQARESKTPAEDEKFIEGLLAAKYTHRKTEMICYFSQVNCLPKTVLDLSFCGSVTCTRIHHALF